MSAVAVGPPRLARDREKAKKRLLRSPRSMGGLARGRVRPDCKEGSRKRNRVAVTTEGPAVRAIRRQGKQLVGSSALRVIRLQGQFCFNLAFASRWPGPQFFQNFSKSARSFGTRLLVPDGAFQKLQIGMTAVSGAALTAIFFFPKENDMGRLSAKFRVFAYK